MWKWIVKVILVGNASLSALPVKLKQGRLVVPKKVERKRIVMIPGLFSSLNGNLTMTDQNPIPPEHRFNVKREEWEDAVFSNAAYFTVFRRHGRFAINRENKPFATFPEAMNDALEDVQALVYAVTATERSVCLVRDKWARYMDMWQKAHP